MPKLTKRLVESAEIRDKDYVIFDNTLPGFGVRILPSGKRSYLVQYRRGRRYRRMALGLHGVLTAPQSCGNGPQALPGGAQKSDLLPFLV